MNSLDGMISNMVAAMPSFMLLLNVVISLLAVFFVILGVIKMMAVAKRDGTTRSITPWMLLLSGAMLWNFATSVTAFLETIYGPGTSTDNLLAYTAGDGMPAQSARMLGLLVMCVRLYGYVAVARGMNAIRHIGAGTQSSEGAGNRALWHLFGGALAINIVASVNGITSFIGLGDVL